MQSVSPVFSEDQVIHEKVIALDKDQSVPVIGLPITLDLKNETTGEIITHPNFSTSVRFRLTDEERAKIAAGADLLVTELLFDTPFTPINIQLCVTGECPKF